MVEEEESEGEIEINKEPKRNIKDPNAIEVSVEDTGVGIK